MGNNVTAIAKGIADIRSGLVKVEVGALTIARGVAESWATPLRWSYGKGDNVTSGMFSLSEMFVPVIREDGKVDGSAKSAKYGAVAESFGIDWSDHDKMRARLQMAFLRGWRIGAAKFAGVDLKLTADGLSVPVALAFDLRETNSEGAEVLTALGRKMLERVKFNAEMEGKELTDEQAEARMAKLRVTCGGGDKSHPVYGALPSVSDIAERLVPYLVKAGLMPPVAKRAARSNDKGATFVSSLDYVAECLATIGDDEAGVALTDDSEAKLRAVAEAIAAYFANHK